MSGRFFAGLLGAVSAACASTPEVPPKSEPAYRTEIMRPRPNDGCLMTEVDVGKNTCAVCDIASDSSCGQLCLMGHSDACATDGYRFWFVKRDYPAAAGALARGCELGSGAACEGKAILQIKGLGCPKDLNRGVEILDRVCRAGRPHACTLLAEVSLTEFSDDPTRKKEAMRLLDASCRAGDSESCQLLGAPERLEQEIEAAVIEARRRVASCESGDQVACAKAATPLSQQ